MAVWLRPETPPSIMDTSDDVTAHIPKWSTQTETRLEYVRMHAYDMTHLTQRFLHLVGLIVWMDMWTFELKH